MSETVNTILLVFVGLFTIVNPIGGAPIFLGYTRANTRSQRDAIALRVAVNIFLLPVIIGLMLEFFGITVPVVRVAAARGHRLRLGNSCIPASTSIRRRMERPASDRHHAGRVLSTDAAADRRTGLDRGRHHHRRSAAARPNRW